MPYQYLASGPTHGITAWLHFDFCGMRSVRQHDSATFYYIFAVNENPSHVADAFARTAKEAGWEADEVTISPYSIESSQYSLLRGGFHRATPKGPNADRRLQMRIHHMHWLNYILQDVLNAEDYRRREEKHRLERARLEYVNATYSSD